PPGALPPLADPPEWSQAMQNASRTFGRRNSASAPQLQPAAGAVGQARPVAVARRQGRTCHYGEAAALFERTSSGLRYRRFTSAALAVRYANEELSPRSLLSSTMEVGDARYAGEELRALYLNPSYPLPRSAAAS